MAMMGVRVNSCVCRGGFFSAVMLAALAFAAVAAPVAVSAQPAASAPVPRPPDAETFVGLAHSSAVVQARAAELVASRETRPEVRSFAQKMVEFRRGQIARLEDTARQKNVPVPTQLQFEHRLILENLEPLDSLELSRRYAEFQVQALEQELQIYAGVKNAPAAWPGDLADQTLTELRRLLVEAEAMKKAVGP
jgi:putative membrane protein